MLKHLVGVYVVKIAALYFVPGYNWYAIFFAYLIRSSDNSDP